MQTTIHASTGSGCFNRIPRTRCRPAAERLREFKRTLQLKLAGSSAGRIVLHLVLAVMTCHFTWHYQGIIRELTRH